MKNKYYKFLRDNFYVLSSKEEIEDAFMYGTLYYLNLKYRMTKVNKIEDIDFHNIDIDFTALETEIINIKDILYKLKCNITTITESYKENFDKLKQLEKQLSNTKKQHFPE